LLFPKSGSTYSEINNSVTPLEEPSVVVIFTAALCADLLSAASLAKTVTAYVVEAVKPEKV